MYIEDTGECRFEAPAGKKDLLLMIDWNGLQYQRSKNFVAVGHNNIELGSQSLN